MCTFCAHSRRCAVQAGCRMREGRMARTLIIEDDDATAALLVDHLGRAGHEVLRLASGEDALAVVLETRPELIVLDWMLPGMSGPEISRQVRTCAVAQPIIVMLTARGD